ncbi:MAG: hypothetical protein QM811_03480 [Pirellulales bacterium]
MLELLRTKTNELTVPQIEYFLNQILNYRVTLAEPFEGRRQFQASELPAAFWRPIVRELRTRWEKAEDLLGKNEKHTLGSLLQRIHALKFAESEYLPFMRECVKTASTARLTEYRTTLFDTLLSRPWKLDNENEAWDLLLLINNPQQPATDQLSQVALLHRWVDAMLAARQQAALTAKQDESKTLETSKQDLAKRQKEVREQALKELAETLTKKTAYLSKKESPLAEWTRLETAWLLLQLDQRIDPAAELAWKLLNTADLKLSEEADRPPTIKEILQVREQSMLKQRSLIMALRLASRKDAKPGLIEQIVKYLDSRIARKDESSNRWRMIKYQFLIARDRPEELERTLRAWVRESDSTAPWRKSLALVLAELGKLDEAIKIFEALGADQQLSSADWRTLATWYTVGNRRTDQEHATLEAWKAMPEQYLAQQLYQARNRWLGYDNQPLPTEMDEATLQAVRALLSKAGNPENYFYQIRDLYRASRDFRVLKTVPRGMLGHSPQQVYPFINQVTHQLLSEIRNEAPADELLQEINAARQEKPATIDARALDLLEAVVERRASEVLNQRGPHAAAALDALRRAFEREWTDGEHALMAVWLGGQGKMPSPILQEEQLRELVALAKLVPENSRDQLRINREYYKLLYWHYERKREAITDFTASLRAYEQKNDNLLPHDDNYLLQDLLSMLQDHGEYAAGEKLIVAHLSSAVHQTQREAFQDMLWSLYNHALEHRGEISLGKGQDLLQALSKYGLERIAAEPAEQRRAQAVNTYVETIDIARRNKIDGAETLLKTFLFEHMAKIMPRQSSHYQNTVQAPLGVSRELLGPVPTLRYGIERMEQWPRWMNLGWNNSWQSLGHEVAQQRHLAAEKKLDYSHLEERLLKLVVENLRHELRTGENRNGYMYHHGYAWREKFPVFLGVADEMHRELKSSGRRVAHIAGYVWDSLEQRTRAIEMLLEAEDDGILDLNGQQRLVEYLRYEKRYPETIVLLERLSKFYPDTMTYRAQSIEAYHFAKRREKAKEVLQATEEHFHAGGRWTEGNIATLAYSLLTTEMTPRAAELFQEAIMLRTRALNRRTLNDQILSGWYQQLAHTYSRLKKTGAAVEAASAGIMCWNESHQHRSEAISTLEQVLSQAEDLPKYIQQLDVEAEKTGRDSPLLRKQLGKVLKQLAKYEDSITQLRLAKELQPNDRQVYEMLVECFDRLQRPAEGTRELLARLNVDRHDLKLYEQLAERLQNDEAMSERAVDQYHRSGPERSRKSPGSGQDSRKAKTLGRSDPTLARSRRAAASRTYRLTGTCRGANSRSASRRCPQNDQATPTNGMARSIRRGFARAFES